MNLLELRTAFIKQSGHYNLVGVQPYSTQTGLPDPLGTDVGPDFATDNGADYFINKALKYLAHRLKTQGTKQFRRYYPVVGQTVLADIDKIIAISDVRCGQYSGRAVTMADVVARTAALTETPTDGAFQYAVGTLSAPTFSVGTLDTLEIPMSRAWRFDGTALRGTARKIGATAEQEALTAFSYGPLKEWLCVEPADEPSAEWTVEYKIGGGGEWTVYSTVAVETLSLMLPPGGSAYERIEWRCSVDVTVTMMEWPHPVFVENALHNLGGAFYSSAFRSSVTSSVNGIAYSLTFPDPDMEFAYDFNIWRAPKSGVYIGLNDSLLTLADRETFSCAIWGIFPVSGIFITPSSDGTPVDVEAWFDPAPLVGNYDANWWTDEHADLIIDGAIIELAAVHMNPSGRHLAAQRDQNLSRIIASDTVTTVETLGNRFI